MAIIDFSYPNHIGSKWQVLVHQTDKYGNLRVTTYTDETKDCAFDTYEMIQEAYRKQREKQK